MPQNEKGYLLLENSRYSEKQVIEAARKCKGNKTAMARVLQCHLSHIYNLLATYPAVEEVILEGRSTRLDLAESKLDEAIARGEGWAITLMLTSQGADRGYVRKTHTQVDVKEVKQEWEIVLPPDYEEEAE